MPKSTTKKKFLFGCGITTLLGLGFVIGFVFCVITVFNFARKSDNWRTDESREFIAKHLAGSLALDEEQKEILWPIFKEGLDDRLRLRREYIQETDRLFTEVYLPRVSEHLTEEQKQRLDKRFKQWRKQAGLHPETGEFINPPPEGSYELNPAATPQSPGS